MARFSDARTKQQREADGKRHSETTTALQELMRRDAAPATATERA